MAEPALNTPVPLHTAVDNAPGLVGGYSDPGNHRKSVHLIIEAMGAGNTAEFQVTAIGDAFPDSGGVRQGRIERRATDLYLDIAELRSAWIKFLDDPTAGDALDRTPFNDHLDLTDSRYREALDLAMLRLARAGHKLFRMVFHAGDPEMDEIADQLADALRGGQQIIGIQSDDLAVPWWMLYVPPDPATDMDDRFASWSWEGFVGYRHLIEHNFTRGKGWSPQIAIEGRIRAGLNVDRKLDTDFPRAPSVAPAIEVFGKHADVVVREKKFELAKAMKSPTFGDQIVYFCCHGVVSGEGGVELAQAELRLTDREPILSSDFTSWLRQRRLTTNPIVFVNACQGGQISSLFFTSVGRELLSHGGNCLVGPQIDIPPVFARAYAAELVTRVAAYGTRLGDVTHGLARHFADTYANPLGLAYSLYRGLDTRFVPGGD